MYTLFGKQVDEGLFLRKLEEEYEMFKNSGTRPDNYRAETVRYVIAYVKDAEVMSRMRGLRSKHEVYDELKNTLMGDMDEERLRDVAKMLFIYAHMYRESSDLDKKVQERSKRKAKEQMEHLDRSKLLVELN